MTNVSFNPGPRSVVDLFEQRFLLPGGAAKICFVTREVAHRCAFVAKRTKPADVVAKLPRLLAVLASTSLRRHALRNKIKKKRLNEITVFGN